MYCNAAFASLFAQAKFALFLSWPIRFQTSSDGRSQIKGFVIIRTQMKEALRPSVLKLQRLQDHMLQGDACTGNWLSAGRHRPKLARSMIVSHNGLGCRGMS